MAEKFGQSNYIGVGVTRGLHSSTAAIYSGSATYKKLGSASSTDISGGGTTYTLNISDIFIDIGVGIGTVPIESTTQVVINTSSTENPNVQVGDVVNFDATSGSLPDQRSRVVGVGTFHFIIEDNLFIGHGESNGNCTVTKLETFLPTGIGATGNYRGAICLNDGDNTTGDYDDFIVRCHSANISGSGSGSVVTSYNYENNGAFYGSPVSGDDEQHGGGGVLKGYIFNDDGLRGNDADSAGGINDDSIWKRVKNTFYRYSIPTLSMEYINGGTAGSGNNFPSGQNGRYNFGQGGGNNRIFFNLVDANGNNNLNFFLNIIGKHDTEIYPDPTLWNFKVTSLETKSQVGIYSSERSYVWCRILTDSSNGNLYTPSGGTTRILYRFEVIACNTNLSSDGLPDNSAGFGGVLNGTKPSIIEWFKLDNTSNGNNITFHGSCDAGNTTAFLIATQKVQNNTWTHIVRKFEKGELTEVGTNKRFANLDRDVLPNLDYRVWNYAAGNTTTTRPYFKIINHPEFDTSDE